VGAQSQLNVSWTAPNNNGGAISSYTLTTLRGGAPVTSQQVSGTSQNVTVDNSESNYTFTVSATNKAGTSGTSNPSAAIRAAGKPGQVSSGTVTETGNSGQLAVTFTPLTEAQRNGSTSNEIRYSYRASSGQAGAINAPGGNINGLPNGTNVTITIIATSTKNNVSGDAQGIGTGNPYGEPNAPVLKGQGSTTQQVHWTWNNPADNGRPIQRFEVNYENGGWTSVGLANRYDRDTNAWSSTKTLKVRACNVVCGASDTANATSGPDPTPPLSQIQAHNNTCPGKPGQTDTFDPSGPSCGVGWVSRSEGRLDINCTKDIYGNGTPWFRVTQGSHPGWFVKSTTVDIYGPRPGGC
jgi:hypothetical protein